MYQLYSLLFWLFTFTTAFVFTQLPDQMVEGGTYEIAWTGATGSLDLYVKKEDTPSSWRSYVCGGGSLCGGEIVLIRVLEALLTWRR